MVFEHRPLSRIEIEARLEKIGRVYSTPAGEFPSVTTVLGWSDDKKWLKKWRDRIGEKAADDIIAVAGERGSAIHLALEKYIANENKIWEELSPFDRLSFFQIQPQLDIHLGVVFGQEYPLWSTRLEVAGRCDLIAEWDKALAIIDFKTSRRVPRPETVEKYLVQAACYAVLVEERKAINISKIVAIVADDDSTIASVFERNVDDFREKVETIFAPGNRRKSLGGGEGVGTLCEGEKPGLK